MFSNPDPGAAASAFAALDAALDELASLVTSSATDDELVEVLRGLEQRRRRMASIDHSVLAVAEERHLESSFGHRSLVTFLQQLLHISTREAQARVNAARDLGPRRELTGAPLAPLFSRVAAAEAAGTLSAAHARTIVTVIDKLPPGVQAVHAERVEEFLVEQAVQFPPETFNAIARRLADTLDPDGTREDEQYRSRHRGLEVYLRTDGSSHIKGELTAPATEALLTVLDATAAPQPEQGGQKDPRKPTQRRHDGLLDALLLVLRAGDLPRTGGVTTTILLTLTAETATDGTGLVTTGHGATMTLDEARVLTSDARVVPVIFDKTRKVSEYGTSHRIFTEGQRLALIARDQGCSFPGCSVPPLWCEAHHVTDFAISQRTCIDDGTMLCGFHHREHARMGWSCQMINEIPHWIPPAWLDPQRTPRRNQAHTREPALV